jgi:hypothetical protein
MEGRGTYSGRHAREEEEKAMVVVEEGERMNQHQP